MMGDRASMAEMEIYTGAGRFILSKLRVREDTTEIGGCEPKDERNCSPLSLCRQELSSSHDPAGFLIGKGANLKALDKHGWSVFQYAVRYASLPTVQLLLDLGADIHHCENKGWNCLHLAARNGHSEKARLLLEHDIRIGETQNQGWNALHLAVRYGQPDTISTLLEYGIDINADNRGWTALHLASLNGHTDITSILLNKRASTLKLNEEGHTALYIAPEFQGQEPPVLPSPPPTPPSAPAFETLSSSGGDNESITEWKDQSKRENSSSASEVTNPSPSEGTLRIQWKSLKEEVSELMRQLDNISFQEVNQIKKSITRKINDHPILVLKFDKQKEVLQSAAVQLENEIPDIISKYECKIYDTDQIIHAVDSLLDRNERDLDLILQLRSNRTESSISPNILINKNKLINDLLKAHEEEICLLKVEVINTSKGKINYIKEYETELKLLQTDLENAERRAHRIRERTGQQQDWFGCPVCLCLLKPPLRIFQCPEGHILCEECKENPALVHCPQCRVPLEGLCSRNRALEELQITLFVPFPSADSFSTYVTLYILGHYNVECINDYNKYKVVLAVVLD
ncbi:ANK [Lepeophtheirus salmonis]|uniref:ANK n=1 Tax=Lepeophtheirus salmonis TaxID=72036 RepID=A0A7R8H4P8_LEPSM|nr:ANK [Lepeophtheirus salmonis]CAF2863039.1 ANK [Lepeophtheirus salmonis]